MIRTAIFKDNNGNKVLLCNHCNKIIKDESNFSTIEKYASEGVVSLDAQYCEDHYYMGLTGKERKMAMLKKGIKEDLREGLNL